MNKKKIIIISVVLVIIVLISLGIYTVYSAVQEETKAIAKQKNEINSLYEDFNKLASSFNENKEKLNTSLEDLYFTTIPNKNQEIVSNLDSYSNVLKQMNDISKKLEEKCKNKLNDDQITKQCNSYKISYKSAKKVYQDDIKNYNDLITKYNDWAKEQTTYEEISKYGDKKNE